MQLWHRLSGSSLHTVRYSFFFLLVFRCIERHGDAGMKQQCQVTDASDACHLLTVLSSHQLSIEGACREIRIAYCKLLRFREKDSSAWLCFSAAVNCFLVTDSFRRRGECIFDRYLSMLCFRLQSPVDVHFLRPPRRSQWALLFLLIECYHCTNPRLAEHCLDPH